MEKPKKVGWILFDPENKTVMLHRRDHRAKYASNKWDYFGGAAEPSDANSEATLIREIKEELGIPLKKRVAKVISENEQSIFYYISFPDWLTSVIKLDEGAGFAWFSIQDALKLDGLTEGAERLLQEFQNLIT